MAQSLSLTIKEDDQMLVAAWVPAERGAGPGACVRNRVAPERASHRGLASRSDFVGVWLMEGAR
jgi:hypothetical protein